MADQSEFKRICQVADRVSYKCIKTPCDENKSDSIEVVLKDTVDDTSDSNDVKLTFVGCDELFATRYEIGKLNTRDIVAPEEIHEKVAFLRNFVESALFLVQIQVFSENVCFLIKNQLENE